MIYHMQTEYANIDPSSGFVTGLSFDFEQTKAAVRLSK